MDISPIAYYRGPFGSKFGIPRQSSVIEDIGGRIVFEPAFRSRDAVKGLEGFDWLWLIWGFSANQTDDFPRYGQAAKAWRQPDSRGLRLALPFQAQSSGAVFGAPGIDRT